MKKINRISFRIDDTLQVVRLGKTSNDKIEANKKRNIVQTYTFSRKQYEMVLSGDKTKKMKAFFSVADTNCLDCPYNEFGKCYTHKFNQYVGFKSMLKSIGKEYGSFDNIPTYDKEVMYDVRTMVMNNYIRFGTYGEPSLHPIELIEDMISLAETHTGYTHQWKKHKELGKYFMASTHTKNEAMKASKIGYRSFIATNTIIDTAVNCPASKEGGYKSSCSKCSLCSGTEGKGNKSVYIFNH